MVQAIRKFILAGWTDKLADNPALLQEQQSWNGTDTILSSQFLLFLDVDAADFDPVLIAVGQFVQMSGDRLAGNAPLGPKKDENGSNGLEHFDRDISLRYGDHGG